MALRKQGWEWTAVERTRRRDGDVRQGSLESGERTNMKRDLQGLG